MASVNPLSRELVFKVVYYGPGLGGKTTTLEHIHATAKPDHRGKLVSLATPVDRTLYFDFLPMRLPPIRGMHVRLQLFTVPGQVYFNATRKLVLTGADGIVFVADSQIARADANLESLDNLRDNLADQGRNLTDVPIVFQYNKHDLPDVHSVEELDKLINRWGAPSLAASARTGLGVYEGLEKITHAVLASFETQMPESVRVSAAAAFDPNEEGLAAALRGASHSEDRPPTSGAIFNRVASSRVALGSIPPETGVDDAAQIEKSAVRPAGLPVTTFPETNDDGWGPKEKLAISPASDASIFAKADSVRAHTGRGSESRSESPRSRSRPSVLPPKPFAPLIPHAAPARSAASHAPTAPANATITTAKEHTPNVAAALAPPSNATVTTSAAPSKPVANADKAPSTEKTVAAPAKTAATAPTKAEPAAEKVAPVVKVPTGLKPPLVSGAERLDPTELFSIADLLEPSPVVTRLPAAATAPAAESAAPTDTPRSPAAPRTPAFDQAPKIVASEPQAARAVEAPKPVELAPQPVRSAAAPIAAATSTPAAPQPAAPPHAATVAVRAEPAAPAPPTTTTSSASLTEAEAPAPPPAPLPPRPVGAIHTHVEPHRVATPAAVVHSTSNDSASTNLPAAASAHGETTSEPRKALGLSFAELWPEIDRGLVHDVEAAIAAGRSAEAIDLADALVMRVLTSTAALFGATDATRDATNMPFLLGIDGRRYLAFRSIVRASRSGAKASARDALAAYAFAVEARMAKSTVR